MIDNPRSALRVVCVLIAAVIAFVILLAIGHLDQAKLLAGAVLALCVAVVV